MSHELVPDDVGVSWAGVVAGTNGDAGACVKVSTVVGTDASAADIVYGY